MRNILLPALAALALFAMGLEGPGAGGTIVPAAQAQEGPMGNQPFTFQVHNNPYAANLAVILKQQSSGSGSTSTNSSGTAAPGGAGSYVVNNYNSSTVGTLNDISQTLSGGSSAYLGAKVNQDQAGNQSSTTDGHQTIGDISNGNNSTTNNSTPAPSSP